MKTAREQWTYLNHGVAHIGDHMPLCFLPNCSHLPAVYPVMLPALSKQTHLSRRKNTFWLAILYLHVGSEWRCTVKFHFRFSLNYFKVRFFFSQQFKEKLHVEISAWISYLLLISRNSIRNVYQSQGKEKENSKRFRKFLDYIICLRVMYYISIYYREQI